MKIWRSMSYMTFCLLFFTPNSIYSCDKQTGNMQLMYHRYSPLPHTHPHTTHIHTHTHTQITFIQVRQMAGYITFTKEQWKSWWLLAQNLVVSLSLMMSTHQQRYSFIILVQRLVWYWLEVNICIPFKISTCYVAFLKQMCFPENRPNEASTYWKTNADFKITFSLNHMNLSEARLP